jgi:glycosyltransferase involved in cell wall biosynthesis
MKLPLVSIVMPTLNSASYIRETIHSLIDQAYTRFELIVVDGGSTDDTVSFVESYLGDGDLTIIKLAAEPGSLPKQLNRGIAAASGEFIARMDSDDVAYKWRLHDQVHFLITNPEISLIGTGVDVFGDRAGSHRSPLLHDHIIDAYLINNPFFHPTIMFRRALHDRGLFAYDETFPCDEDYELWGRLIPQIKCANLDQSSIRYRIHGQNTNLDPRKHTFKRKALRGFCESYGIADDVLVEALVDFQCGTFLRHTDYVVLREYANWATEAKLPKLGWIHEAIVREKSYPDFLTWFRTAKGWAT